MSHGIYIIEDEAIVARDLKSNLELLGHRILAIAHDPKTALQEIPHLKPDIVLSDVRLRNGDGIEIMRELKRHTPLPVIFISAYSDKETLKRAREINPQGYILKPINRQELEISIDLAIDEFAREQTLFNSREILNTALGCIGTCIILTNIQGQIDKINTEACELLKVDESGIIKQPWQSAIVCVSEASVHRLSRLIENAVRTQAVTKILPVEININENISLIDGIVGPIYNNDRDCIGASIMLRHLADTAEFASFEQSRRFSDNAAIIQNNACLLLITPDNFAEITQNLRSGIGDAILNEISLEINKEIRVLDLATRYGGAVFTATLPNTPLSDGLVAAKRIFDRLSSHQYYSDKITLTFSIGIAGSVPGDFSNAINFPITLFRHATWALNVAHESGGNCIRSWQGNKDDFLQVDSGSLSDKFSPNIDKDIQGVMLLWNTVSSVAHCTDIHNLSQSIIENLAKSLKLTDAVFLLKLDNEPIEIIAREKNHLSNNLLDKALDLKLSQEIVEAALSGDSRVFLIDSSPDNHLCYGIPLSIDNRGIGLLALYRKNGEVLTKAQISFLETLSGYLSVAVDRVILSSKEQLRIQQELKQFEDSVQDSKLIYESGVMQEIMQEVRILSPTDAPVMITGESGTGKELLARIIHRLSPRKHNPFIVFDCAAVVPSLIESELFGHKKGAFTNANESHRGKFKEADSGTLFLDEIGELPLALQVKLLRFAQEKTFCAVGNNQVETVDVRLIVATNKVLESEVSKGNFRKDLFYRLNVFSLHSPSLRQRPEDVLAISEHYLIQFNQHYNKTINGFTDTAKRALLQHDWPGNVRELRNQVMRAVIICCSPYIDAKHLTVRDQSLNWQKNKDDTALTLQENISIQKTNFLSLPHGYTNDNLAYILGNCIDLLKATQQKFEMGKWLESKLIQLGKELGDGNLSESARILGIPETTLRRRVEELVLTSLPPILQAQQSRLISTLKVWLNESFKDGDNKLQQLKRHLSVLAEQRSMSRQEIATLVGISTPTLRKILTG